ncbi:LuxR C-terminal-related transcriptional regulator [Streptomyces sp. NPDC059506]
MRTHLRELVQSGAEVRTAATLPMRLIIVDRSLAIVPAEEPEDENAAMVIRNAALVSVLRRVFDHCWASAADLLVGDGEGDAGWAVAGTRNHEVVRMLAAGLTDEAIGRKLGLSDRTVRRIVAELMSQVGAESRFQAGVNMVRLGWLDDAPPPPLSGALPAIG